MMNNKIVWKKMKKKTEFAFVTKISHYRTLRALRSLKHVTDGLTGCNRFVFIGEARKKNNNQRGNAVSFLGTFPQD